MDHVIHQVGGASAAYLGGVLRISFGTYLEAFLFAGLLRFAAAAMALSIGPASGAPSPRGTPCRRSDATCLFGCRRCR